MSEKSPSNPRTVEPVNPDDADALFWAVFDAYMAKPGIAGRRLAAILGLDPDEHGSAVQSILNSPHFRKMVLDAQRDLAVSVVERFKRNAHKFADRMEDIALTSNDIRSAVTALKDLLDRAETGSTRKVAITTPTAYKKIVEELAEKSDEKLVDGSVAAGDPADGGEASPAATPAA